MKNKTGFLAEKIAAKWLIHKGFKIVDKNVWLAKYGEIDIIAKKGSKYHFIEVKALASGTEFSPEINFTKKKQKKVEILAQYFANKNRMKDFQVDLLTIVISEKRAKIRYYPNIQ